MTAINSALLRCLAPIPYQLAKANISKVGLFDALSRIYYKQATTKESGLNDIAQTFVESLIRLLNKHPVLNSVTQIHFTYLLQHQIYLYC